MEVKTPSRLHITLIDLNGKIGRIDGGIGITLKKPSIVIKGEPAERSKIEFSGKVYSEKEYINKIKMATEKTLDYFDENTNFEFNVKKTYPAHAGLGSGTQTALATAKIISHYLGYECDARSLAKIVGRGGTSGIGVAAFENGGFIVDGGHSTSEKKDFLPSSASKASPPPILVNYNFPKDWKIIVAMPYSGRSISGNKEVNIFKKYCPIPLRDVEKICHIILMKMLPALIEKDIEEFGDCINKIQNLGFKKIERELQSKYVDKIIENMKSAGAVCAGMSSFGPTVYGITDSNAKDIANAAREVIGDEGEVIITNAQNKGAEIKK